MIWKGLPSSAKCSPSISKEWATRFAFDVCALAEKTARNAIARRKATQRAWEDFMIPANKLRERSLLDFPFYMTLRFHAMRWPTLFAISILVGTSLSGLSAQTLPAPQAVTDPRKISSRPNAQIEPRGLTIDKLYMTRQIGRPAWSPDGKCIAFISNMSGRNNLWLVAGEGGFPAQLTVSDQRETNPAWSPDGKWIAYQSDYDGDEQWDIFLVSPKTGKIVNLTQTRAVAESSPTWSPDGRYLAYEVKPKTSAAVEIDVYDMVMREVKHLTTNTPQDKANMKPIWSKDGAYIVYTQEHAKGTDSNIFIASLATAKSTLLTAHKGEQLYFAHDISSLGGDDAQTVLFTSNAANGYDNVGTLLVGTHGEPHPGDVRWLTKDKWEISGGQFSPDGKHLTFSGNVDGNQEIYLWDLATGNST